MGQHHRRPGADPRTEAPPEGSEGEDLAHAFAFTLLLDPSGGKFGKTAAGTSVWLDADRTTPYAFYQYWLGQDDARSASCCASSRCSTGP